MELCEEGDLWKFIKEEKQKEKAKTSPGLSWETRIKILLDVARFVI